MFHGFQVPDKLVKILIKMHQELFGPAGRNSPGRRRLDVSEMFKHPQRIAYPVEREIKEFRELHDTDGLVGNNGFHHQKVPAEQIDLILHLIKHLLTPIF
jgi:hypothetical protein